MAIDFSGAVSIITADTVMYAALAFFVGMACVISYHRLRNLFKRHGYQADEAVVDAIVLEYSRRLGEYDRVIADLRTKVDILEIRAEVPHQVTTSQLTSQAPQHHTSRVSDVVAVTQHPKPVVTERLENQNGTTDYILKMLAEKPLASREVQLAIGRTREHTARLMKKLNDSGLVERNEDTKPFKYKITESGRERLKEKAEVASELRVP
ncbi:MAG TPA: helix-turn-helix domain-containing protein [Nitrososphaera sp.]|nr:helix-turn-helix domain-containing protein [Nitrososphaera sp.]